MTDKPVWTLDQIVAQLDRTHKSWTPGSTVSYAVITSLPAEDQNDSDYQGFQQLSAIERSYIAHDLALMSDVINIHFVQATDTNIEGTSGREITFGASSTLPDYTWGWTSTGFLRSNPQQISGASIWLNSTSVAQRQWVEGGYNGMALLHEIGHALGLSHPGDYNADGSTITYDNSAVYYQDSRQYTIMSYFDASSTGANFLGSDGFIHSASTLLIDDIAALQSLYGANYSTRSTDTVYGFNNTAGDAYNAVIDPYPIFCVWDGGGFDTLDFSGFSANQKIDLHTGVFSDVGGMTGNVSIAYGATVEDAIGGSGADILVGNDVGNRLTGGAGSDTLTGNGGADTFVFSPGFGTDTVNDFTLGDGDRIDLSGFRSIHSFADVVSHMHEISGSPNPPHPPTVVLDFGGGDTLTLQNMTASALSSSNFLLVNEKAPAADDLDLDGKVDFLWRNDSGEVAAWSSRIGDGSAGYEGFGVIGTDWKALLVADFDGDGKGDVLWRNTSGETGIWSSHLGVGGDSYLDYGSIGSDWTIAAAGDFDGDGKADILWRNSGGGIVAWESSHGVAAASYVGLGYVSADWHIAAVGDLTGDGKADVLWRNDSGEVGMWSSNLGGNAASFVDLGYVGQDWSIAGTGDFDGDGKLDVLWRNANGATGVWESGSGQGSASFHGFGSVPTDWTIQFAGDVNGDGKADIIWRNSGGETADWLSGPGLDQFTAHDVGYLGQDWHVIGY